MSGYYMNKPVAIADAFHSKTNFSYFLIIFLDHNLIVLSTLQETSANPLGLKATLHTSSL
jgi:hypothetical protein